jgi:hypothetical protein
MRKEKFFFVFVLHLASEQEHFEHAEILNAVSDEMIQFEEKSAIKINFNEEEKTGQDN